MTTNEALEQGREHFSRQDWGAAFAQLSAADRENPLALEDIERLAVIAFLTGRDDECADLWARAHQVCLDHGNVARAVRCAFWLGLGLMTRGEPARGGGWLARAQRLLDEADLDCVERGYMLVPAALQSIGEGNFAAAYAMCTEADQLGRRFSDPDLMTLGRLGRGQTLILQGQMTEGVALLDEVMVSVTAGDVSPILVGLVYCAVIEACHEIFDLRRAQEWTTALTSWCASQPDLAPYRGQCLVHRAEIMHLHGAWADAMVEAQRARDWLSNPPGQPAVGAAFYQQAELHRLCGDFQQAEDAYREASQWGRSPQPGLALLWLAQGQTRAAEAAIRRVAGEALDPVTRSRLLLGYVEIMLAVGDTRAALTGADELAAHAETFKAPLLVAIAAYASGGVLLAEGDARGAIDTMRRAWTIWSELDIPFEAARARVLIGLACRELGDEDTALMELDAARRTFDQLGALPELARVETLSRGTTPDPAGGLTGRELEVLRLVAGGSTNRASAAELFLSEKTVARHLSNIFAKLNVSSRSAATAYAFENDLH